MKPNPRMPSIWEPVVALVVLSALLAVFLAKSLKLSDAPSVKNRVHLSRVFVAVLAMTVLLTGCKSTVPGRFTTLDWDSRSPEQIAAAQIADTAVYGSVAKPEEPQSTARFADWVALAKVISEFRVRIRIGALEWGSDTRPVTTAVPVAPTPEAEAKPK